MRRARQVIRGLALGAAAFASLAVAGEGEGERLLARADSIRNPDNDFSLTMTLAEYRRGKMVGSSVLTVYSKPAGDLDQLSNIVRYRAPKSDSGKIVLRNGSDLWFYDPASKASVRLSPQARLLGQASTGDVMSTRLAKAYAAAVVGREPVPDDSKTARPCVKLRLTPQRGEASYARVDYWIDESTARPLKAQFFTGEGRLLKTAFFRRYQSALGRERPTETVIIDGLDPEWITVLRATDYQHREIPRAWLQRDYLPHLTGNE